MSDLDILVYFGIMLAMAVILVVAIAFFMD